MPLDHDRDLPISNISVKGLETRRFDELLDLLRTSASPSILSLDIFNVKRGYNALHPFTRGILRRLKSQFWST
jgi:hypothetical protein